MPLPYMKIDRRHAKDWVDQESLAFCTIGPVLREYLEPIVNYYSECIGKNLNRILSSHEVSSDGHPHIHILSEAHSKMAYAKVFKQVQKFLIKECGPRESGLNYSVRFNKIPSSEQVKGKQLYGWAVGEHYLTSPTKEKQVGDTFVLEIDDPGFNIYKELAGVDESIDNMKKQLMPGYWPPICPVEKVFLENQIAKWKSAKKYYFWWYTDYKKKFPDREPHKKAWGTMTFQHARGFEKNALPPIPKNLEFS